MHLPGPVHSHCLAFSPALSAESLEAQLIEILALGFDAHVIVAAIIDPGSTPTMIAEVFRRLKVEGLVCGFNPGNGPDPLSDDFPKVLDELRRQAEYALALAETGFGPPWMVGPMHTWHMKKRDTWPEDRFRRWMDELDKLGQELDLELALEPLRKEEDGTPVPFKTLFEGICERRSANLAIHFDTGHAHTWGLGPRDLVTMADYVNFIELVNEGRHPLREDHGIDFPGYKAMLHHLPDDGRVGVEPFDYPSVIEAFNLGEFCTTRRSGRECLSLDAVELRELRVMR